VRFPFQYLDVSSMDGLVHESSERLAEVVFLCISYSLKALESC
jgi:hypothetical protein